jgi:hypothetical protein
MHRTRFQKRNRIRKIQQETFPLFLSYDKYSFQTVKKKAILYTVYLNVFNDLAQLRPRLGLCLLHLVYDVLYLVWLRALAQTHRWPRWPRARWRRRVKRIQRFAIT